jgi:hypothetical protein
LYDSCMGRYPPDHDDCNVMLFYPDWAGSNEGCIDDGKEPYYMLWAITNISYPTQEKNAAKSFTNGITIPVRGQHLR